MSKRITSDHVLTRPTDADMAQQAELTHVGEQDGEKSFWMQYRVFHAAFAQFCYTGAQGRYLLVALLG